MSAAGAVLGSPSFSSMECRALKGMILKWVQPEKLWIDSSAFEIIDLSKPFSIDKGFDLAVCLEVGEHLPAKRRNHLWSA